VISPLLSNLYMRRFVLGWKRLGREKRFGAYIVNYADDMVICCRGGAEPALAVMRTMMSRLKLTLHLHHRATSRLYSAVLSIHKSIPNGNTALPLSSRPKRRDLQFYGTLVETRT
jgi:hypothetical protein